MMLWGLRQWLFWSAQKKTIDEKTTLPIYVVTDVVMVEHTVGRTTCDVTDRGSDDLANFLTSHRDLVLLGWAHSHHQLQSIPQGRSPSQKDIDTQFTLQRQYVPGANLMLIINEVGVTCWTLPHNSVQLVMHAKGESPRVAFGPEDLVEPACFVRFDKTSKDPVRCHQLGSVILPIDAGAQAAGVVKQTHVKQSHNSVCKCGATLGLNAKFCGQCGLPCRPSPLCPGCSEALQPAAKFCGHCGMRLSPLT